MNIEYRDFIGIYSDLYPEGYCQHLISEFDRLETAGAGSDRLRSEKAPRLIKNDYQIGLGCGGYETQRFKDTNVVDLFFDGLQACYDEYTSMFSSLQGGKIIATTMKMQRTGPGGGYHVWHHEQGPKEHSARVVVYMLYLNTLEPNEAGETEFLYQKQRISPQENTMLLWPASYTHVHRGNAVFGERSKYIVTGWFYYE